MASAFAPQLLLGAVAGLFADRLDRKRTMIVADLLLAGGLLPLLLVDGAVPDDKLVTANAVNGQVSDVSRLAGSALGVITHNDQITLTCPARPASGRHTVP
jgi:MFS family permease